MSKRRMGERKMRINPKRCIPSSWPGSTRPSTSCFASARQGRRGCPASPTGLRSLG